MSREGKWLALTAVLAERAVNLSVRCREVLGEVPQTIQGLLGPLVGEGSPLGGGRWRKRPLKPPLSAKLGR